MEQTTPASCGGIKSKSRRIVKIGRKLLNLTALLQLMLVAPLWAQSDSPPGTAPQAATETAAPGGAEVQPPAPPSPGAPNDTAPQPAAPLANDSSPSSGEPSKSAGSPPAESATQTGAPGLSRIPDIRARTYPTAVSKKSASGNIYLFDDTLGSRPFPGRVLLLKKDREPVAGLRVLRTYAEKKQFAAKLIKIYPGFESIPEGESFSAIEKVSDLTPPPISRQDKKDLKELESPSPPGTAPGLSSSPVPPSAPASGPGPELPPPQPRGPEPQPFDAELDAGTSPPASGAVGTEGERDEAAVTEDGESSEDDPTEGLVIEEVQPLEPYRHSLSFQGALLTTLNAGGSVTYLKMFAAGVRYGFTLGKMIFLKRARVQDALIMEGGVLGFRPLNFEQPGDAYSVVSLSGSLRYTIQLGQSFGVFGYLGALAHRVVAVNNGTNNGRAALSSSFGGMGLGMLFNVGPSWDLRLDMGIDMLAMGLMLRF